MVFIYLTKTSKMPCPSWGLPTSLCKTGGQLYRLGQEKNLPIVCRICYGRAGHCGIENAKEGCPAEKNFFGYQKNPEKWVEQMVETIWDSSLSYFRWLHCGDVQSPQMILGIFSIAEKCPNTKFWLPTKELSFLGQALKKRAIPENLVVRLSEPYIDRCKPSQRWLDIGVKYSYVHYKTPPGEGGIICPSYRQDSECKRCRACWDKAVPIVGYPLHVGKFYWPYQTAKRLGLTK